MNGEPAPVEILHTRGCGNWSAARDAVYRVAEELGLVAAVRDVVVDTDEAAQTLHFLGSPTVRVCGHDVEPGIEERGDFGLG